MAKIGRDVVALRQEWAKVRLEAVEQLFGEEVARWNSWEAAYWSKAVSGNVEAAKRVLAIQRERVRLLRLTPIGGALLPEAPGGGPARERRRSLPLSAAKGEGPALGEDEVRGSLPRYPVGARVPSCGGET
ncbi:MAG: hypothetical protein ACRDJN_18070 [Chloroflexota bacterium]